MRKLMEVWVDEERGFLTVKHHRREYRLFGGFDEHQEEDMFKLGDDVDAIKFMLKYFNVSLKMPTVIRKIKEDSAFAVTELHTAFKLVK
jgi:hypothetical protein